MHRAIVEGDRSIVGRPIVLLCDGISPTAIAWLVIAIVIYAIKRRALGPLAHIGEKNSKIIPPVTNPNATTSIV